MKKDDNDDDDDDDDVNVSQHNKMENNTENGGNVNALQPVMGVNREYYEENEVLSLQRDNSECKPTPNTLRIQVF